MTGCNRCSPSFVDDRVVPNKPEGDFKINVVKHTAGGTIQRRLLWSLAMMAGLSAALSPIVSTFALGAILGGIATLAKGSNDPAAPLLRPFSLRTADAAPTERGDAVGASKGPHEVTRIGIANASADLLHTQVGVH